MSTPPKPAFSPSSFIAGFMLGLLSVGVWFANDSLVSSWPTTASSSNSSNTAKQSENSVVSVADQPAGGTVTVESVTVPPPGAWVAVREVANNELGNILGAAHVTGPRTGVDVQLLRATEPGLSYAIELYRDDGDNTFDLSTDSVYIDFATGAPAVAYFSTTN